MENTRLINKMIIFTFGTSSSRMNTPYLPTCLLSAYTYICIFINSHRLPNQKFHPDSERGKGLRSGRCNRWMLLGIKEIGWPEEGEGKAVSAEIASDTNPAPATPA